ncbi:hypothetical protein [Oceanobacillus massiliensis]|uniref:hypothetical protein n=1 Tax=Oceanobacillus massiliensis TaxID=1465765 RepID=UPI000289BA42|nr:hypothetical protein [Oceanobacillus massiliensis]
MRYLTDEELELATRFLFLSMAMVVIRQDIGHAQNSASKLKEFHVRTLEKMETEAAFERRNLKTLMRKKNMKIVTLNKNDSFSSFLFLCQGREEKRNYFNPAIRNKVAAIVQELTLKVLQSYQQENTAAKI